MPVFEERPRTLIAEQWDGTIEGFKPLYDLIVKHGDPQRIGGYTVATQYSPDGSNYSKVVFQDNLYGTAPLSDGPSYMHPNDWLAFFNDRLVIMDPDEYVLAEKLATDRYYAETSFDIPASTWQMLKAKRQWTWGWRWLVRRYPVVYNTIEKRVAIKVERYASYPEADVVINKLGRPIPYERVKRIH